MPVYDYRCTQCGREVEVSHGIHDAGPSACDRCGGQMRKALSTPAIHFKGSGWAKKDARSAAKPATAASSATGGGEGSQGSKATGGDASKGPADTGSSADGGASSKSGTGSGASSTSAGSAD